MKTKILVFYILKKKEHLVFVPKVWEGIKNVLDVELKWKENLPNRIKPKARLIDTALWNKAEKEFNRFKTFCGLKPDHR